MERTVELVCFNYHIRTLVAQDVVCTIVFSDASKKSIAVHMTLMKQMRSHTRSGSFAMSASHTKSFERARQCAKHLSTFLNLKALLTEEGQLCMLRRNGRSKDNERAFLIATRSGNEVYVIFIVNQGTFLAKLFCQFTWCPIIATNDDATT